MCQAFSCIVTKTGKTYYKVGLDSHDVILDKFHIRELDDEIDKERLKFARVEITPKKGYLYPEGEWVLQIDERIRPTWWTGKHEKSAYRALAKWKARVYSSFNLQESRNPINPLLLSPLEVTETDIENLRGWDSVWASVWTSVGDSVWDSVGDSVGAYIGSMFPKIRKWQYINHKRGEYPYQSAVDLWKRGLVPSFNGKLWRLHSGEKAEIVWEGELV